MIETMISAVGIVAIIFIGGLLAMLGVAAVREEMQKAEKRRRERGQ